MSELLLDSFTGFHDLYEPELAVMGGHCHL